MDDLSLQLRTEKTQVIEADISKYFDTIPHDKLLAVVAKRIVDENILRLIKLWLKSPVVEEGKDGKKRTEGNPKGTPQGGVISPLLANIHLHVLDRAWRVKRLEERFRARLIRYADDFMVLCQGSTERVLKGIEGILRGLELSLNQEKTKVINAKKERFYFLGFTLEVKRNPKTGKLFPLITPSRETMAEIKTEIRALTCRNKLRLPTEVVIRRLSELVRGWVDYFFYGNCSHDLSKLKSFLDEWVRTYLRRKHAKKSRGYKTYPYRYIY
jgi:RNA-directed DNA polymerase